MGQTVLQDLMSEREWLKTIDEDYIGGDDAAEEEEDVPRKRRRKDKPEVVGSAKRGRKPRADKASTSQLDEEDED